MVPSPPRHLCPAWPAPQPPFSPPTLTRVSRQLDPRVVFSEGDHKGRILQNCLQLLPRLVLCGAERVGSGLRPGREGEVSALRGNQGAAWGLSKGQGELPGITGLKLTGVSKAHFSNHEHPPNAAAKVRRVPFHLSQCHHFFFWLHSIRDLGQSGIEPYVGSRVLTTGPPGKSLNVITLYLCLSVLLKEVKIG